MNLISCLESNNVVTKETLKIFLASLLGYVLIWVFRNIMPSVSSAFIFIVLGGLSNLYVISFNNNKMPVLVKNKRDFAQLKKLYPNRGLCIINKNTKLRWLSDRINIGKCYLSIGDILAFSGLVLLVAPFL